MERTAGLAAVNACIEQVRNGIEQRGGSFKVTQEVRKGWSKACETIQTLLQPKVVTDHDEAELKRKMEELGITPEELEEENEEGMTAPKELEDQVRVTVGMYA